MLLRVLDALGAAREVENRIVCGPTKLALDLEAELRKRSDSGEISWIENRSSPSSSTFYALQSLPANTHVLVTTADHALLSPEMVDHFCSQARATDCDIVVGLARHEMVAGAYPQTKRTVTRLQDGAYCTCNLFAFLTTRARAAADFWRRVETHRKKTLRVIGVLGWMTVLRYLFGRLSLDEALGRISRRLNIKAGVVMLPFPEAAVDVDTVSDWRLVESIVGDQGKLPHPEAPEVTAIIT
jgi:CTP:molybdopterin cytidylyltransferase MocA